MHSAASVSIHSLKRIGTLIVPHRPFQEKRWYWLPTLSSYAVLILASASPRRHELLLAAGIPHRVRPAHIPETALPGESPLDFVRRLSNEKAHAVPCDAEDVILAADTIVCVGDLVLGKPSDREDASRMLRLLSGREHVVHTGICLRKADRQIQDVSTTRVSFAAMSDTEIEDYVRTGEPDDKAGAYAIQGLASKFVTSVKGCYHNVVGLPVALVYRLLKDL
ncbi:MAG: septum formation inhibitor Maf [Acidobacteriaceae bacterium]|nr:septum formation inhibitor Maf [Acidobacteriaceae bacterium]